MFKRKLVKVKYKLPYYEGVKCCPASLKLDLRWAARQVCSKLYFNNEHLKIEGPKHVGGVVFGMPDKWKGVLTLDYAYEENEDIIDITIGIEEQKLDIAVDDKGKDLVIELIKCSVKTLLNKNIILDIVEDYTTES